LLRKKRQGGAAWVRKKKKFHSPAYGEKKTCLRDFPQVKKNGGILAREGGRKKNRLIVLAQSLRATSAPSGGIQEGESCARTRTSLWSPLINRKREAAEHTQ